jgi:hypothetical protein
MSTQVQYYCDRCGLQTKSQCIRYSVKDYTEGEIARTPELCPTCVTELQTMLKKWCTSKVVSREHKGQAYADGEAK